MTRISTEMCAPTSSSRFSLSSLSSFLVHSQFNAVASLGSFLVGIFRGSDTGESTRNQYNSTVALVNELEAKMSVLSDSQLKDTTSNLRNRARHGEPLDTILPEAFSVVREASKRVIGLRPFDVQLIGGMVLHKGEIAEMRTGEGKTLVAILAAYLNALSGKGVHVVTLNDYLARRDSEWVGQVPRFLGMKVGLIQQNMICEQRRKNYSCDITYVTNSELGSDYLRDNLAMSANELVLRPFNYCVIDEVDSILIDEARTPLIISGPAKKPSDRYYKAAKIAPAFERDGRNIEALHQDVEAKEGLPKQNETVTASICYQNFFLQFPKCCGMTGTLATESLEFESIYNLKVTVIPTNKPVIREEVSDMFCRTTTEKWRAVVVEICRMHKTGRPVLVGTTSVEQSDSLSKQLSEFGIRHEVLNAKPENAEREAEIVAQSGRLGAVTIATNMAGRGIDIILGGNYEFMARLKLREMLMPMIVKQPEEFVSLKKLPPKKSWKVNDILFPCKLSEKSVKLAEEAVQLAVKTWGHESLTELEAEDKLFCSCRKGLAQEEVMGKLQNSFLEIVNEFKVYTDEERKKVVSAGGLHVVGSERHELRRIDNQLRGRCGCHGDPGSSRFFLSLEDNIFKFFGGDKIQVLMRVFKFAEDLPVELKMLSRSLDGCQCIVENHFFRVRKQLFEFDEVLNSQRDHIYAERRWIVESECLQSAITDYAELTMDSILAANINNPDAPFETRDLQKLVAKVHQYCYLLKELSPDLLKAECSSYADLKHYLHSCAREAYFYKREMVEERWPGAMEEAEKFLALVNIDRLWNRHLQALVSVRHSKELRRYTHKVQVGMYKQEASDLFVGMIDQIRRNVIYSLYELKPELVKEKGDKVGEEHKK